MRMAKPEQHTLPSGHGCLLSAPPFQHRSALAVQGMCNSAILWHRYLNPQEIYLAQARACVNACYVK